MTVKLHVGYVGKTRNGQRVEIVGQDSRDTVYPFKADNHQCYSLEGAYIRVEQTYLDIIGPWVEPVAVKSPIETVTETRLVNGDYGKVWVYDGDVGVAAINTQSDLEAAIETLIIIRDAKVLK